eukprot:4858872-Prymnesium_polylepis.2
MIRRGIPVRVMPVTLHHGPCIPADRSGRARCVPPTTNCSGSRRASTRGREDPTGRPTHRLTLVAIHACEVRPKFGVLRAAAR